MLLLVRWHKAKAPNEGALCSIFALSGDADVGDDAHPARILDKFGNCAKARHARRTVEHVETLGSCGDAVCAHDHGTRQRATDAAKCKHHAPTQHGRFRDAAFANFHGDAKPRQSFHAPCWL